MGFLWAIVVCLVVGGAIWWYQSNKGKSHVEVRALSLLTKISELINENPENAQQIIKRYTSGEARIRDILIFKNLQ